jgi:wyosine [tRNA(Phe)-imidazoG37] synthetase (radical SAM superfamily)
MFTALRANMTRLLSRRDAPAASPVADDDPQTPDVQPSAIRLTDPRVGGLWPADAAPYSVDEMSVWDRARLDSVMTGDAWRDNLMLNKWEFATGATRLESFPFRYSVPFVICNARCEFCSAWTVRGEVMPIELIERTAEMLPYLVSVDLVGWGEPLIHPQMGEILKLFEDRCDPRANLSLTTNGTHLERWAEALVRARVGSVGVSLHAARPETHEAIMGLPPGAHDAALRGLRRYRALNPAAEVELIFIVTQQNIAEIPDFIALGEEMAATRVHLRTLRPRTKASQLNELLDYQTLPAYLHPEFEALRDAARRAVAAARVEVHADPDSWSAPIFGEDDAEMTALPARSREERRAKRVYVSLADSPDHPVGEPLEGYVCDYLDAPNPFGRQAPELCPSPYTAFYVNGFDRQTHPCCSMEKPRGHAATFLREGAAFDDVWNSPGMQTVRRTLRHGPLLPECSTCTSYW